jgi:hypothetical protein
MTPRSGFRIGIVLFLIALGTAYLAIELIQRNRYADMDLRMEAALREFEKRARFRINGDGDLDLIGESETPRAVFQLRPAVEPSLRWRLALVIDKPDFPGQSAQYISISALHRRRTVILRGPVFRLAWLGRRATHPVVALFYQILREHGVQYEVDWPDEDS